MFNRRTVGAAAGATLGYIGNNTKGAVAGAKIGYALAKAATKNKVTKRRFKRRRLRRRRPSSGLKSHADMTLIKFRLPGKKRLRKVDRHSKITYTDTYSVIHNVMSGLQGVHTLRYNCHRAQFTTNPNASFNVKDGYNINLFDLNVNKSLEGSVSETGTTVLNPQINGIDQDAVYLGTHTSSMSITSMTNVPAHMELYFLLAKRDGNDEPVETWNKEALAMGNPQATWVPPTNQAGAGITPGAPTEVFYGQDPTFNPVFKKYWKILKKQEFILQAGNTIRMEFSRPINHFFRKNSLPPDLHDMIAGLTFVPMIVVKPGPVAMKLTSGETNYVLNTAAYKFGVMTTDTTTLYPVPSARLAINRVYSANMARTFNDINQEFIDDEDSEQAVTVAG